MSASELFEALRTWRNSVAESLHREPYMVLQNSVLLEIATKQPATLSELKKLRGMGEARVSQFGHDILAIIKGEREITQPEVPLTQSSGETIYSVGSFLDGINHILSFQNVIVQGEIGSVDTRGRYTFFTLLDPMEDALINCFVWQDRLLSQGVTLTEGMTVQVAGHPNIYKRNGRFTFEVDRVSLVGEGQLKIAFEKLKARLSGLGYFAPERKRPLPRYIWRIGLITSSYADARKDFLTHLGNFGFVIDFYHVRVEGIYAVDDIIRAFSWFNKQPDPVSVIVLTRGGGSLDSMQAFNNEGIAKTIFASRIPVLTAIGHENDISIADLVADVFASTPTHAGRILSEDWRQLPEMLLSYQTHFTSQMTSSLSVYKKRLGNADTLLTQTLTAVAASQKTKLHTIEQSLSFSFMQALRQAADGVAASERLLLAHDPLRKLEQGYSIVRNEKGNVIKSSRGLAIGQELNLTFAKGAAETRVTKIQHEK